MEIFNNIKKQFDVSQIINKENKDNSKKDLEDKTILTSDAEDTYTSLLNQERSKILANNHNFGIAEALVKQFSRPTRNYEYSFNKQQKE